jgi:hypothetical protein
MLEYETMVQMCQTELQWQTGDGFAADAIDAEIVTQMTQFDVDCHDLPQALLAGEENEKTILYKLLVRERLTEKMKDLMRQLTQGPNLMKPVGKGNFPRAQGDGRPAAPLGAVLGRMPALGRRMSRPNPLPTAVVNTRAPAVGGPKVLAAVAGVAGIAGPPGPSPRRLSRPVAVRRLVQTDPAVEGTAEQPSAQDSPLM